uniref:Uncharacterized protein n=1 Tax=viral metagenome TaxID=1070528 RepID=A0A6M3LT71_9ZZZZ
MERVDDLWWEGTYAPPPEPELPSRPDPRWGSRVEWSDWGRTSPPRRRWWQRRRRVEEVRELTTGMYL